MKITFLVSGNIQSNFSYRPLALARSLHARGHTVSIIAPKADKYNNFISETITNIDGVRILQPFQFTTKRLEINLIPYIFGAIKLLLQEKPDLVYIYKPTPISIIGLISKLFRKTTIVTDFDDLGSEVMKIEGHPWHQRILVTWSEKISAKYADRLSVASSYLFNIYHKQFSNKPICIIPNGIESEWLNPLLPAKNLERIVFMGSINRKNILEPLFEILPKILITHQNLEIVIIGDGKFLNYFKQKAEDSQISKNIIFTGWLTLDKAKTHLHTADIGYNYMPDEITTRAASNMKVSQYMSRGVIPLVSDVGDLSAIVNFGKAGYISIPDNIQSLEDTVIRALEDKDRLQKAEHARFFASQELTWNIFAKNFDEWLDPSLKNHDTKSKKIYMVTTTTPGNVGGGEIRNYNLIKQLVKQNNISVEVFCIKSSKREDTYNKLQSELLLKTHVVDEKKRSIVSMVRAIFLKHIPPFMDDFKSSTIGKMFKNACEKSLPDIVLIEQLSAYYCIEPHIAWLKNKGVKIIFDCHNVEFQSFKDLLEIFPIYKKLIGIFLVPYLKKLEIQATKQADMVLACSELDACFFKQYNEKTHIVPNGVDCSEFKSIEKNVIKKPIIVFMGGIGYPPNSDGIQFYLREIHPKVRNYIQDIELLAIGADKKWLDSLNIDTVGVKPLGFVPDVQLYLNEAYIGICPIRYGSGTRIKIMTYMAAGLPVVSTYKGAEGVNYSHGKNIITTDDPQIFADSIIELLKNKSYSEIIAKNGHDFILENYDWNVIGKNLQNIIASL